ncbi:transposase [Mesorhizobium camelthorni]|uniref:Transposase n=1 Tax=Allomesorhizobium camelthorni TaxID=475069 RepID=A0A6G4WKK1_9HYPH|nr:Tn3 family transposase [Mesorhizobium camelthorni]NGO55291.1 transposase [Mesorhizobium camelthorni]
MRLVASLKAGLVTWSAMLRKLAAYERQNRVDIALALLSVLSTPCLYKG